MYSANVILAAAKKKKNRERKGLSNARAIALLKYLINPRSEMVRANESLIKASARLIESATRNIIGNVINSNL